MKTGTFKWTTGAVAAATVAGTLMAAAPAWACGGFFCSRVPVDQTGENILFVQQGDEIEAHVNILYQGSAEDFAWIVPTPSRPEIGIGHQRVFQMLSQRVGARFQLDFEAQQDCFFFGVEDDADAGDPAPNDGGGVTVVQQSSVGPFDFAVLQATDAESLFAWLQENNYDIPDTVMPFVEPYIIPGSDMHFVAFRLQNNRDVGDIAPVTMRYRSTQPMVPIQLTAIASQPDLGVMVNVLAEQRAVPQNYLHVHINEARVDWLNGGSNYNQLINEAMDEAGGQGFFTEYAGAAEVMDRLLFVDGQYDTARLSELDDPIAFFQELQNQGFTGDSQLLAMLQRYIPIPAELEGEVEARDFYNCLECYEEFIDREGFDAVAFANELEASVVAPLRHAQELFDTTPYLTRMFTTLSAEEMDRDPVFAYNTEMGDVDNVRRATVTDMQCDPQNPNGEAVMTIELSDGRTIEQVFNGFQYQDDADAPAAAVIEQTGDAAPRTVRDITTGQDDLDDVLNDREDDTPNRPTPSSGELDSGVGCATAPGQSDTTPIGLLLLALGLFVARRRQR